MRAFICVKQNRFNSTLQLVKRQLQAGRFGKLAMVAVNVFWQRPQSYYDQDSWRGTWEFDGGALMNQASHYVDLLDWLSGASRECKRLDRHVGTGDRGRRHSSATAALAQWRIGHHGGNDAHLPQEP